MGRNTGNDKEKRAGKQKRGMTLKKTWVPRKEQGNEWRGGEGEESWGMNAGGEYGEGQGKESR